MDLIAYLLLGLVIFALWLWIFARRADLRKRMMTASAMGGIAGPISELWYLADYWRPPAIFHIGIYSPEDVLFGFAITGVAAAVVQWWTGKRSMKITEPYLYIFMAMLPASTVLLIAFTNVLGFQSILVSAIMFLVGTAIMLVLRRDLLSLSFESGIATALIILPMYVLIFGLLAPEYWNRYWLWTGTPLGFFILPGVPWTEVFWYFSWGSLAGITGHFIRGTAPH